MSSSAGPRFRRRRGTVIVPYCPARKANPYPCLKPASLDTGGRPVSWSTVVAHAENTVPQAEDNDFAEELAALANYEDQWQVVWSPQPAMYFSSMAEVRECVRSVYGIKDPASLGWQWLTMDRANVEKAAVDRDVWFRAEREAPLSKRTD